ncbi:REP-associated tyrosine transposase [Andreprevotia chitinilytica]|uniref:REP-associated tyrosine transposase n=1 Tax=Andreprevotia chitinilytica TaxID=396808 RepID=UPI000552223D|nr:transposase [Andreprevotia chitinilytica]
MVQYRRNLIPGGTYFFTLTLHDRRSSWLTDHIDALRDAIAEVQARRSFQIVAAVVLPEHLHMVWRLPDSDSDYASRWAQIKRRFNGHLKAAEIPIPKDARGETLIWQRRYWEHTIRDDADFAAHVDYIHYNPVKHGLVEQVIDWPYSSFHRYVSAGLLPQDWGGSDSVMATGEP